MTLGTGAIDFFAMCAEFGLNPATAVFPRDFYGKGGATAAGTLTFLEFRGRSGVGGYAPAAGTYNPFTDAGAASFTVSCSTSVVWTYTVTGTNSGIVTKSIASGASATSITFTLPAANTTASRSATVTLQSGANTWTINMSNTGTGGITQPCVQMDSPILMAGGSEKAAADIAPGDMVWTRHEETMEWGAFPVEAVSFHLEPLFAVPGHPVTSRRHRFALPAFLARRLPARMRWWRSHWLGRQIGMGMVARITVADAHTYVARNPAPGSKWRLSHNAKQ